MTLKDEIFKVGTSIHEAILRATKGKVLGKGYGMPMLILETTGAKSGEKRTTVLSTPVVRDDIVVLVASFGGDDRNPAWFHNVKKTPEVTITMDNQTRPMVARITEGEERDALWAELTAAHDNYAGYQKKTDRKIPVVVLEPPS
jgi:deazaflavin-dependent oxidoreductase (nitroreductase family)